LPLRSRDRSPLRVGLISDTHDLLRAEALERLRGADHIIHAGDFCSREILDALTELAPVTAVRGNNDRGTWARELPKRVRVRLGGVEICVIHERSELDYAFARGARVVVFGHSHKPLVEERGGVLLVNPGSAGPRRFKLPIAVGELLIARGAVTARIVELPAAAPAALKVSGRKPARARRARARRDPAHGR
jgi:putative phosphoesterase